MKTLKTYTAFNERRYGNPWVAKVGKDGKLDFTVKIGGYTGGYNKGEAGELYIEEPEEGAYYGFGQKDYRGHNTEVNYCRYQNGEFTRIGKPAMLHEILG